MEPDLPDLTFFAGADDAFRTEFEESVRAVRLQAGEFICMEHDACAGLPIVTDGIARVYKMSGSGRELTLYRIERGGSCILTASCLASDRPFPAFAIAETAVEALFVGAADYRRWIDEYPTWRHYVFDLVAQRIGSVIELVEEVAFHRMDARLASHLLGESVRNSGTVQQTHEGIATDLGTSREVVSRLLKEFEKQGLVSLSRGAVEIRSAELLADLAAGRNTLGSL